jgi:uncharacterized protein (TIGR00251 family)
MDPNREFKITDARRGVALNIKVVTQAEQTEFSGIQDGVIKIRLMASPAGDPAANRELVEFLAAKLNVDRRQVAVVAGESGRDKIVSVEGMTREEVDALLTGGTS